MQIRPIADEDIEHIVTLWQACGLTRPWNDPLEDIAFARKFTNSTILIGLSESSIVASVMAGHDGHRGWVYYVAAEPTRRGEGFGRAIMNAAEDWLRSRGVWKIHLLVRNDNSDVIRFYEHLGYRTADTVCMQKPLR